MGGLLRRKFQSFAEFLNSGCDQFMNSYIEDKYKMLTTISAVHPMLDRDKPLSCARDLSLLVIYSAILIYAIFVLISTAELLSRVSFAQFTHTVHISLLLMLSVGILWHSWSKRRNTSRLHRIIAENFFDYHEDLEEIWKVLREAMTKERGMYIRGVVLIGFATSTATVLAPIVNKLGNFQYNATAYAVNFDLPVPVGYPFTATDPFGMALGYFYIMISATLVALQNCTKSFMAIETNLNIQMHLKLLIFQIERNEERAVKLYVDMYRVKPRNRGIHSSKFSKCYNIFLRKAIQHHQIIISATNEFNDVFGFYVFFYYLTVTLDIAMSMLATSSAKELPGTMVSAIIMCTVEIAFVALFAHMGQRLTDLSTDLREVIYGTPWYRCDEGVKRTIQILQIATLKPINFSFYSLLNINYDSFATVMHSAYSYYNLVNAYNN